MDRIKTFDIDLGTAFAERGSVGAAVQIARGCFGLDVATTATAAELLNELQRPEVHATIEWRQDRLLLTPEDLGSDLAVIARENQGCWRAAQRTSDSVEIGNVSTAGWTAWGSMDLGDFLLRLLSVEAVVGHGPSATSDAVTASALQSFELLAPVVFPDGGLMGVAADAGWFGVFASEDDWTLLYASPAERVQHDLAAVAPGDSWIEL